ncbi:hypothetical protein SAY87_022800 [Trapa incisa]|uniref:Mannose-6-phosphate isomerase n=1 Tax=Trapa incisa TaxID=236973 RepID=A0AAN7K4Q8_9MYRT|nr:hypothetical protein SAY87_022800 [Trapa incisa]
MGFCRSGAVISPFCSRVGKALSIQAHPDKELARQLHNAYPNVYKDDNHKPEMTLAITKFEALCGFISFEELKDVLWDVPEIAELVGTEYVDQYLRLNEEDEGEKGKPILQSIFTKLMSARKEQVSEVISKLRSRLDLQIQVSGPVGKTSPIEVVCIEDKIHLQSSTFEHA